MCILSDVYCKRNFLKNTSWIFPDTFVNFTAFTFVLTETNHSLFFSSRGNSFQVPFSNCTDNRHEDCSDLPKLSCIVLTDRGCLNRIWNFIVWLTRRVIFFMLACHYRRLRISWQRWKKKWKPIITARKNPIFRHKCRNSRHSPCSLVWGRYKLQ